MKKKTKWINPKDKNSAQDLLDLVSRVQREAEPSLGPPLDPIDALIARVKELEARVSRLEGRNRKYG